MTVSIRIEESAHAMLRELAKKENVSLSAELSRALETQRRKLFCDELESAFAAMTAEELADYHAEAEMLAAGNDGLEQEDWSDFE